MVIHRGLARAAAVMIVALSATRASGYAVGPAVALAQLAKTADLVCKATVVADRPTTDAWFEPLPGFEVRDTELRVVSVVKGAKGVKLVHFHHYAPTSGPAMYAPQSYRFTTGRSYLVFAAKGTGGVYRQVSKSHTAKEDQGVMLAADARPHRGKTITEVVWAELQALLASTTSDDVVTAIAQLDEMSGGRDTKLADFERPVALAAIRPLITSKDTAIATAAITVFGADSPYFVDADAAYWLAGIGKGTIPGLGPRTPTPHPTADVAVKELIAVADSSPSAELRGLAIRALGRSRAIPAATIETWSRDRDPAIRRAAVLVSAELADHTVIAATKADTAEVVRQAVALAIGFSGDSALLPLLDPLLKDAAPTVRMAAAMSLLAFSVANAAPVMKANLTSEFRPLFVNALAHYNPQPYLAMLAEVIEKRLQPTTWWGGTIPAGDSWKLLFDYVKARPAAELTAGTLDASLDALEKMQWFSSSEPRDLYALYLRRGLPARAKRFRATVRKSVTYDIDYYFDMADKDPSTFVP